MLHGYQSTGPKGYNFAEMSQISKQNSVRTEHTHSRSKATSLGMRLVMAAERKTHS